jgi:hypothetical protein
VQLLVFCQQLVLRFVPVRIGAVIALFGHTGSQASQAVQTSVIISAMAVSSLSQAAFGTCLEGRIDN